MRSLWWPLVAGVLFGVGLLVAGMTQPGVVVGFLDVAGSWNPTAAFVVGAAVIVHGVLLRAVLPRESPLYAERFHLPTKKDVDRRLVVGSAIFGVGWGIGGICPGPGLVMAASLALPGLVFVVAMTAGMAIQHYTSKTAA